MQAKSITRADVRRAIRRLQRKGGLVRQRSAAVFDTGVSPTVAPRLPPPGHGGHATVAALLARLAPAV